MFNVDLVLYFEKYGAIHGHQMFYFIFYIPDIKSKSLRGYKMFHFL